MPRIDLTGQVFGRLTVIAYVGIKNRAAIWTCFCKCGNKIKIRTADLRRGHTKSCGCLQKDLSRKRLTKHGLWDTPSYQSWRSMKQRCTNPTNIAYKYYGGRGISFCSRWDAFENFFEDMGERPIGLTLERVDNEKGYSKENCKWANQKEQIRNSRIAKLTKEIVVEIKRLRSLGVKIAELASSYNVDDSTISSAINGKTWN